MRKCWLILHPILNLEAVSFSQSCPFNSIQVNEKSCRLRMAAYRGRKGDEIGMGSHVCMCIIMRRSKVSLPN